MMFYGIVGGSKTQQICYHLNLSALWSLAETFLLARGVVRHSRDKKGTGTEMHTAIVSGIVTGDVAVSYWPVFFSRFK